VLSVQATIIGFTIAVPFVELLMEIAVAGAEMAVVVHITKSAVR
jgi:hypothetical protein